MRLRKASGIAYWAFSRGFFASACGEFLYGACGLLHGVIVVGAGSGGVDFWRRVVAVGGGEILHDLDAAAMAVHVAEAADVHEDVEAELLSGGELPRQLIVLSAMAQAEVDDFASAGLACGFHGLANLPVGIVALAVDERGGELDFQRIGIDADRRAAPGRWRLRA